MPLDAYRAFFATVFGKMEMAEARLPHNCRERRLPFLLCRHRRKDAEAQLQALVQAWLDRKASVLSGDGTANERLQPIARAGLINQVRLQRAADQSAGRTQKVEASVDFMRVISRTPNRIELRADVDYSDETLNAAGTVVERTAPKSLKVSYILGRDDDGWRLQAYQPL